MLSRLRRLLENWVARVLFALLFLVFVFWGVSNVATLIGSGTTVAHIGGQPVDISVVQAEYQKELQQASQNGEPDLGERRQIAQVALAAVLRRQALQLAADRWGVTAPDNAIRQAIYAIPAFQTNGVFDQTRFTQLLQQNNLSPGQFFGLVKNDMISDQILSAVLAGVAPPSELNERIFSFVAEQRVGEQVVFSAASQPAPPLPGDAALERYWRNHPDLFIAPEYRQVKIVILAPQTLAPNEPVSDAEIKAAYASRYAAMQAPATRSVQVITVPDMATGARLAASWKAGASWAAMQAAAAKDSGSAVVLDDTRHDEIPTAALADAVFAAQPNRITGPVQGGRGYFLFNVTAATAGGAPPYAEVADQIRQQLQLQKAQAEMQRDVDNVQDALAGQTPLDHLPGNLGLVAVEGTLDATGKTPDGEPAPIPGGAALREAIIKDVFTAHIGDPPQLTQGPDGGWFAFSVDTIKPAAVQPYDAVRQKVALAWLKAAMMREAEMKAAALLHAVSSGQSFDAVASAAGEATTALPPATREGSPPAGVSPQLVALLFTLAPGQATMLETDRGFAVTALVSVTRPKPADDPDDFSAVVQAMTKSLDDDMMSSFTAGLQARARMRIDNKLFSQIYQ